VSVDQKNWFARFDDRGAWGSLWLGFSIVIGYLLVRCAFDVFFLVTLGFPEGFSPLWQDSLWWPEVVNALLIAYVPVVLIVARRWIDRDLTLLRPVLPCTDAEISEIRAGATRATGAGARLFKLSGIIGGFVLVLTDPSVSRWAEPSLTHPTFMWALIRVPLMAWLIFTLIVSDLNATRSYFRIGRSLIEVDLLDVQSLSPFARRGLRSALMWVIFSILLSLFWLGESVASPQNFPLLIVLLVMASVGFAIPLIGVHENIRSVKRSELDRLRDEIRVERAVVVDDQSDENSDSPRLANLIAYYQLVDQSREWPIDAANILRFFIYLLIGLGSWLGAALVERLLDTTLG